jgi:ribonuclease Z
MNDVSVLFAGTGGATPSTHRGLAATLVADRRSGVLVDCGEGTARQLLRAGAADGLTAVLITHLHADHWLGLPGLLNLLGEQGRREDLELWGPPDLRRALRRFVAGCTKPPFRTVVSELTADQVIELPTWNVTALAVKHRGRAFGYALEERAGRRRVVFSGDTAPCEAVAAAARNCDLLVHEAMFLHEDARRARETAHSTAREAGLLASLAGVRLLALTHLSGRVRARDALAEARAVCPRTVVPRDLDRIRVPG